MELFTLESLHKVEFFKGVFDTFDLTSAVGIAIVVFVPWLNDIPVRVPA